jgi:hypothetical protein
MLARTGQIDSELRRRVYDITGRLYSEEANLPATPEMRIIIPQRLHALVEAHKHTPRAWANSRSRRITDV